MIRSALLLCGALVAAAYLACAPPPAHAQGLPPPAAAANPSLLCDPAGAIRPGNIVDLANAPFFDPKAYAICGLTPGRDCRALRPVPGAQSPYAAMIAGAFNSAASAALKRHLCGINYIYIDPNTDPSDENAAAWGMREIETDQFGNRTIEGRHIGLRVGLLPSLTGAPQGSPGPFASYQTKIIHYLLDRRSRALGTDAVAWVNAVGYSSANPDPGPPQPTMAILGILAHEMGHILYVDHVQRPPPPDPDLGCTAPGVPRHNHSHSWSAHAHVFGYHSFGVIDYGNRPIRSRNILHILTDLRNGDIEGARADLVKVYSDEEWASLFATVAADEDFVETYMLHELNIGRVPLTSLQITIPPASPGELPSTIEVMQGFSDPRSALSKKAMWIDRCL
jgi:hypothetical protein